MQPDLTLSANRAVSHKSNNKDILNRLLPVYVLWLCEKAKRRGSKQRYKGLGESIKPILGNHYGITAHRQLNVRIEDAIAASRIFTLLIGDDVETL